jgi:hypothetical protein
MLAVAPTAPVAEKNTVTYQRGPLLREWYVNEAAGLKSWFEIKSAPPGAGSSLRLELAVRGNTLATMGTGDRAQSVEFRTESGASVIQYSGLKAWDATGRELACTLSLNGDKSVVLNVNAAGALFPVTIDPLATNSSDWTAEGDQMDAQFGYSVASAGDVNGDGYSDVIVGAPRYDNGESDEGQALVYLGSASGLAASPAWTAEGNQANAWFGYTVASAGDVNGDGFSDIIVGAPYYDNGPIDEGRAFLFLGSASGLLSGAAWTAESDQQGSLFGQSVASAGDINGDGYSDVIIGAPRYTFGETGEGRAFVYLGSASGLLRNWAWSADSNQSLSSFGYSVASAGDVNGDSYSDVIISAPFYSNDELNEGRTYVYLGSASGLGTNPAWTAESNLRDARFGSSVASAGDINGDGYSDVIIGASGYSYGYAYGGRAFAYLGSASGLAPSPAWTVARREDYSNFGFGVASAGDINGDGYSDVVVTAYGGLYAFGGLRWWVPGRVFVYYGSSNGLPLTQSWMWSITSNDSTDGLGVVAASAGDVNGDGLSDIVVGARSFSSTQGLLGRAFVFYGLSAPDINVTGAGFVPETAYYLDNDLTYFGQVVANAREDQGLVRTFQIKNQGPQPLQISGASISGTEFKILSPTTFPLVLQQGETTLLRIRAVPRSATYVDATVIITSNDPDTPNYSFEVGVTGISDTTLEPGKSDNFTTTAGWLELGIPDSLLPILGNPAGLGSRGYDPVNTALLMTLTTNTQTRVVGWREDPELDLPYSSIGPDKVARASFALYSVPAPGSDPSPDPNEVSSVPNFRLRLMQNFVINSMLEVNHNSGNTDPAMRHLAREFAPSSDPVRPSIYTVDLDPVEIPYLLGSAGATVGVQRGVETVGVINGLQPDFQYVQGTIGMTDSSVGTYPYPNAGLPGNIPVKTYESGLLSSDFTNNSVLLTKFQVDRDPLFAGIVSGLTFDTSVTLTKGSNGITVDTRQVPASKVAVAAVDFLIGNADDETRPEARLRVDPERLYKISFIIGSDGLTTNTPQIRLRARTAKFQWTQILELGGAAAAGSEAGRTIAAQALPGTNSQNAELYNVGGEYHLWFSSPLSSGIRADVPGTLFDKFPLLMAQPGMGDPSPQSARDLKIGFDIIDTISAGIGQESEAAMNINLYSIEIRDCPQVDMTAP